MTRIFSLIPLAAVLAVGCSGPPGATVSGEVTYDGQPVKAGYVTFTPTDGQGPMVGAPITDGRYTADKVPPGPKIVKVESGGAAPSVQTSADGERAAKEHKGKFGPDGIIRTELVPAEAEGNNKETEIKLGPQTLDLHLKVPTKK